MRVVPACCCHGAQPDSRKSYKSGERGAIIRLDGIAGCGNVVGKQVSGGGCGMGWIMAAAVGAKLRVDICPAVVKKVVFYDELRFAVDVYDEVVGVSAALHVGGYPSVSVGKAVMQMLCRLDAQGGIGCQAVLAEGVSRCIVQDECCGHDLFLGGVLSLSL